MVATCKKHRTQIGHQQSKLTLVAGSQGSGALHEDNLLRRIRLLPHLCEEALEDRLVRGGEATDVDP